MENEKTRELMLKDKFVECCGIRLTHVGDGEATSQMEITPNHLNGMGTVQGGAIFTLADFTCAAAANSREKAAVSLDGEIDFYKAVSKGTLTATATEVSLKRTIAAYNVEVRNDEGALVAAYHSKVFRKDI